jgi:hypothetical protein
MHFWDDASGFHKRNGILSHRSRVNSDVQVLQLYVVWANWKEEASGDKPGLFRYSTLIIAQNGGDGSTARLLQIRFWDDPSNFYKID